jgi:hypothetical protein
MDADMSLASSPKKELSLKAARCNDAQAGLRKLPPYLTAKMPPTPRPVRRSLLAACCLSGYVPGNSVQDNCELTQVMLLSAGKMPGWLPMQGTLGDNTHKHTRRSVAG